MATLALTNAEIFADIGQMLGISRDPATWDTTTEGDVNRIIRSGRRRFFSAHRWNFLRQSLPISIAAPIDAGTVTIVDGVVTRTGTADTWPQDVDRFKFCPDTGGAYDVESRTSDTVIVLVDKSVAVDAGSSYNLYQIEYDLPDNFGGWEGPITIANYRHDPVNESRNFPEWVVRGLSDRETVRTGQPSLFCVVSSVDAETAIATRRLMVYPLPDKAYIINTKFRIAPGDTLDMGDAELVSDPIFSECYKEALLSAAEVIAFGQAGGHSSRFMELLQEAVKHDNMMTGVRVGRPRRASRSRSRYYDLIVGTVDMSGQE